jgi:hypothetical protein
VLLRNFRDIRVDLASETVTVGASVQMVDVRDALRPYGMQTEVTPEIGNATAGSVACCGTKDASVGDGLAQVSSTVVRVRLVDARGDVEEVSEDSDPERLRVIRSSYGLLGVIFEVTFRIQPSVTLRYDYTSFRLYPPPSTAEMRGGADGMLGLAQPYANKIVIERRYIDNDVSRPISRLSNLKRGIRDKVWEFGVSFVPTLWPSNRVYDLVDRSVGPVLLSLGAMGVSARGVRTRPSGSGRGDATSSISPFGRCRWVGGLSSSPPTSRSARTIGARPVSAYRSSQRSTS